jgi:hypothetical protein
MRWWVGARRTPRAPVHRALLLRARRRDPLEETVHVEDVRALAPDCARRQHLSLSTSARHALSGQSSPGILHAGQHASYGTRQIPHTSSSSSSSPGAGGAPVSQRQAAIAFQDLTVTFIECFESSYQSRWPQETRDAVTCVHSSFYRTLILSSLLTRHGEPTFDWRDARNSSWGSMEASPPK